ncbi:hypothetical protein F2Q70_00033019 [Brassica cretica]|uniref:Thioredoxin domain-containing protein n=1 Tax=Brassica cretica TaxID=69181 RepID=A0A8S9FTJ5_BRACR|nr:hypothetical protein F2Q70_00033019 [Brassica cretica]
MSGRGKCERYCWNLAILFCGQKVANLEDQDSCFPCPKSFRASTSSTTLNLKPFSDTVMVLSMYAFVSLSLKQSILHPEYLRFGNGLVKSIEASAFPRWISRNNEVRLSFLRAEASSSSMTMITKSCTWRANSLGQEIQADLSDEDEEDLCPVECVTEFKTDDELLRVLEKAKETNTLVVVDFYRPSCGSCKYIEQGFSKLCKQSGLEAMQLLSCLNLSHNRIRSFSALDSLRHLKQLRVLDVSHNNIGEHSVDTTRYLCSSPLSNSEWTEDEVGRQMPSLVTKYWDAYFVLRDLNLKQLDIAGNMIAGDEFYTLVPQVVPTLVWLNGHKLGIANLEDEDSCFPCPKSFRASTSSTTLNLKPFSDNSYGSFNKQSILHPEYLRFGNGLVKSIEASAFPRWISRNNEVRLSFLRAEASSSSMTMITKSCTWRANSLGQEIQADLSDEDEEDLCPVECVTEFKTDDELLRVLEKAKETNTLVVVDFYRPSCGSCKYIEQGFSKLCKQSGDQEAPVIFLKHNSKRKEGAFFESLAFDVTGDPRTSLSIEGAEAQFHEFQPGRLLSCVYVSIHGARWRPEIDNMEAVTALVLPRARSQDGDNNGVSIAAAVKTSHPRSFRHLLHSFPRRILTVRQRSYGSRDLLSFHYLFVRSDIIHRQLQSSSHLWIPQASYRQAFSVGISE